MDMAKFTNKTWVIISIIIIAICFICLIATLILPLLGKCTPGKVYLVGGEDHYATLKRPADYQAWAASKQFYVGDILRFRYYKRPDSALRATELDHYRPCITSESPIATYYHWGYDEVKLDAPGDYFFDFFSVSGVYAHCQDDANQKLHAFVNPRQPAPAPAPSNSATSSSNNKFSYILLVFSAAFLVIV